MYDALTGRYTFSCPHRDEARVTLSSFRLLRRLPGAAHPAVFEIRFDCGCGEEHVGLVAHDDLDWAPLGVSAGSFLNLMTSTFDDVGSELTQTAAARVGAGEWPWSFYCYLEGRPRPVFPSSFVAVAPGERSLGLAVRCPVCGALSVNLVSRPHVDLPFWNDVKVGVVDHVFPEDAVLALDAFHAELDSARFDERRLNLE
ncbi:MAG: hypothetical protein H0V45_05500 [Actinobacteria bacterium]|nr:hypothetical protein [Actinomycetota bacterium]